MEEGEQDKTEQPTPFKLVKARTQGTVARGMDLGFLTALVTLFVYAWTAGPNLADTLLRVLHDALSGGSRLADGNNSVLAAIALVFSAVSGPVVLLAVAVFAVVLLFEVVQIGGFVFSAEPLRFDFSRLNPAKGLKRVFSVRLLIETGKQILKLVAYTTVGYAIIHEAVSSDLGHITDGITLSATLAKVGLRLVAAFIGVAIVFAALDQIIVRRDFLKRMRMSRREVRREMRDREGEPRLKQKRRQLHAEFAKASQSVRNLRKSDVVIANPEHIAIGLRYAAGEMTAPQVVSIGTNQLAQRLKRLAFIYGIPVIEDRPLARALFRKTGLGSAIPESSYSAVAAIYNALRQKVSQNA